MPKKPVNFIPLLGGVFLGIALYRFLMGDGWIVWVLLGFLFGGFGFIAGKLKGNGKP